MPQWVAEIQIMELFGWTERELHEELSAGTLARAQVYWEEKARAEKQKQRHEEALSKMRAGPKRPLH